MNIYAGLLSLFPLYNNNWRLNWLHIKRAIEIIANPVDFGLFLNTQKNTLEDLSLITEDEELIAFIFEKLENLQSLVLSGSKNFPHTVFSDNFFILLNMKCLKITAQSRIKLLSKPEWLLNILRHVPALEKLVIDFYEVFSFDDGLMLRLLTFPVLKYIEVKKFNSRLLKFASMPQLETLSLEEINDDEILIFITVKNVIIKKMYVDFHRLVYFFPNMEYLRIEENWDFSYAQLKFELENHMKKLKKLEIARHILPEWISLESWKITQTLIKVI